MPEFKEVKNFPSEADDLVNLPVYEWITHDFEVRDADAPQS